MASLVDDHAADEDRTHRNENTKSEDDDISAELPPDEEGPEAGSSSDEEGADEDDEFIAPDEEPEEAAGVESGGGQGRASRNAKKKREKKRQREVILEQEDYDLLEENTGVRVARPQQHRRLKKARDVRSTTGASQQHDTAEQLRHELFGPDQDDQGLEDDLEDDIPGRAMAHAAPLTSGGPSSLANMQQYDAAFDEDEDDWIVNEFEEEGAEPTGRTRRKRRSPLKGLPGVDPGALEEANDIFGDVDELLSRYQESKAAREGDAAGEAAAGQDDYGDLEEEELEDEEAAAELRDKRQGRGAAASERARRALDPEAVAKHHLTARDEQIRAVDLPEREQLLRGPDPANFDLDACADWVVAQLVGQEGVETKAVTTLLDGVREVEGPPPEWMHVSTWPPDALRGGLQDTTAQRGLYLGRRSGAEVRAWTEDAQAQAALRASVRAALQGLYVRHEEVPLLGMYRKEALGELLALRADDEPEDEDRGLEGQHGDDDGYYPYRVQQQRAKGQRGYLTAAMRRARRWDILYEVEHLSRRWRALQRRREARAIVYRRTLHAAVTQEEHDAVQRCLQLLEGAGSEAALQDVEAAFCLAAPPPEDSMGALALEEEDINDAGAPAAPAAGSHLSQRRPGRLGLHIMAARSGLGGFVASFALDPAQLGSHLEQGYKLLEPPDCGHPPEEEAASYVDPSRPPCRDAAAVLRSASALAAALLAAEPAVRRAVRDLYWQRAVVSTQPTAAGESTLDPFHPLGAAKRLHHKPLRHFRDPEHCRPDLFLRIITAEREGLVTVQLGLPEGSGADVVAHLADLYLSSAVTPGAQAWNALRVRALREAVDQLLLPALDREAREQLASQARGAALQALSDRLWALASAAPLRVQTSDEDEGGGYVAEPRFMAVCHGPGQPPTAFVMLDAAGTLVDFLHCPQLSGEVPRRRVVANVAYSVFTDPRKAADAARVRTFIEAHLPHAIVVGVASPDALAIRDDVQTIIEKILYDNPRVLTTLESGGITLVPADEAVAAAWENSAAAREELPAVAAIVRRAVALGRHALDPLAVLSSLAGAAHEVLSLPLHPLQAELPQEERMRVAHQVLAAATAQAGLDLNAAAATPWLAAPLQFVPGLGPRKAAALLRAVARAGGVVESRLQVWRDLGMGPCVFRNAAPFLRMRPSSKAAANLELNPLDDTRVHPESYAHALAIASSAAGGSGEGDASVAIENALAAPGEVLALQLDVYDRHLQDQAQEQQRDVEEYSGGGGGTRLSTLIDIQFEFVAPYGEVRPPRELPSEADLFWLACGEGPEGLRPGRRVEARVRYVGDEAVRVVLPDLRGLEGTIRLGSVSSNTSEAPGSCREFFKQGDTVTAVVEEVDPGQGLVQLSTASKCLNAGLHWEQAYLASQDSNYVVPDERQVEEQERDRRRAAMRAAFVSRPILHPLFHNCSASDAAREVLNHPVGAAVVRPAARSLRTLHVTLHVPGGGVWHVDVKETGKASSSLQLAPPLTVEPVRGRMSSYDDLDELSARFIDPVATGLRALHAHSKWMAGDWKQVQGTLESQKQAQPGRVVYCLGADDRRAGAFYLAYIINTTPRREFFVVVPEGFYFRKKVHPVLDKLIGAWKRSPRPVAAPAGELGQQPPPQHVGDGAGPPWPAQQHWHGAAPGWPQAPQYYAPTVPAAQLPQGAPHPFGHGQRSLPPASHAAQAFGDYRG